MEFLEFDLTPSEENCSQVGKDNYYANATKEYETIKNQLIRIFGNPPNGVFFKKSFVPHDFGSYIELRVYYDNNDETSIDYAFKLENEWPAKWDQEAIKELESKGYIWTH